MAGVGKLSRYQDQAIAALLLQPTMEAAAEQAGVGLRTLERWLAESPEFRAEYRAARRRVLEGAIGQLQQATTDAVGALRRNLDCGVPNPEIRAAVAVLRLSLEGLDVTDVLERLEAVEREVLGGE